MKTLLQSWDFPYLELSSRLEMSTLDLFNSLLHITVLSSQFSHSFSLLPLLWYLQLKTGSIIRRQTFSYSKSESFEFLHFHLLLWRVDIILSLLKTWKGGGFLNSIDIIILEFFHWLNVIHTCCSLDITRVLFIYSMDNYILLVF
jgi:hypothetical protein